MKIMKLLVFVTSIIWLTSCSKVSIKTAENFEQLELPDNTLVYLNQHSTISYNTVFNPRTITLEGEAFFSVVSNDIPFIIETSLGDITVLGTAFNVNTTNQSLAIEVEHGNVELKTKGSALKKQIKNGERAIVKSTDKAIKTFKAEFKYKSWMTQLEKEFKKMGKTLKKYGKNTEKEIKKVSKKTSKDSKKVKKEIKKESKKIINKLK